MAKLKDLFSEQDRKAVSEAIREAESKTSGEIVVVVAAASGRYDRSAGLFAMGMVVIGITAFGILLQGGPGPGDAWNGAREVPIGLFSTIAILVPGYLFGLALASFLPDLKMLFADPKEVDQEVQRSAAAAYQRFKIGRTVGSTGILIYVSLLERKARVVGDGAINGKVEEKDFQELCRLVTEGLAHAHAADGLRSAVRSAGDLLARHFPLKIGDKNELSNDLNLVEGIP